MVRKSPVSVNFGQIQKNPHNKNDELILVMEYLNQIDDRILTLRSCDSESKNRKRYSINLEIINMKMNTTALTLLIALSPS